MSFTSPVVGGHETRVDQGVDYAGFNKIVAVAKGRIVNVYSNLSGFGQTIIEKLSTGQEVYYAEETGGGTPTVHTGETVQQGEELAPGTGGVIEAGFWDPSTGRSAGAPGYTEGKVTQAGLSFQRSIRDRSTSFPATSGQSGITRPGGAGDGQDSGQSVEDIFTAYQDEIDAPRVAPPRRFISTGGNPLFAPFSWWWQSFSGRWAADMNPKVSSQNGGQTSSGGPSTSTASSNNPSVLQAQSYARSQLQKYGWGISEMAPLVRLWNKESGWNASIRNPTSGAAGIPQDITGDFHGGYQGQIDWGLNYIKQRYGSPSAAWAHETAHNWY